MSDDLISRKALYQELARLEELAMNRFLDTPTSSPCYNRYNAQLNERTSLKHMIADAPIAYDVDKVIEELERNGEKMSTAKLPHCYYKTIGVKKVIDIVKGGGIDE